jgi:voltage-gated potassium channel Kch
MAAGEERADGDPPVEFPLVTRPNPISWARGWARQRSIRSLVWPLLGAAGLVALVLGAFGYAEHFDTIGREDRWTDVLYYDIKLFGFGVEEPTQPLNWRLEVARWIAPVVAGWTALLTLFGLFRERVRHMLLPLTRGHYLVCGLGEKGLAFTRALTASGAKVVAIERDPANEHIAPLREAGTMVVVGDARDPEMLRLAAAPRARHVIAVCADDGVNAEIALQLRDLAAQADKTSVRCLAHIVNADLSILLRLRELSSPLPDRFRLDFFNVIETGARELLTAHAPGPRADDTHVLVVGAGEVARWLLLHMAREWSEADGGGRPWVTVVDADARERVAAFTEAFGGVAAVCELRAFDIARDRLTSLPGAIPSGSPVTIMYVCLDDDGEGLATALGLRQESIAPPVPIVVCMTRVGGLSQLLDAPTVALDRFFELYAYSLLASTCDLDLLHSDVYDTIARARHDGYVRDRRAAGETPAENTSLVPWDRLPEDLRESNRDQAAHIGYKLRAFGCTVVPLRDWSAHDFEFADDEIEEMARVEHDRFVAERIRQGWRFAPGPKNNAQRTSPTLIPWEELSEAEREKDREVVRDIPRLLARVGFQIVRAGSPDASRATAR